MKRIATAALLATTAVFHGTFATVYDSSLFYNTKASLKKDVQLASHPEDRLIAHWPLDGAYDDVLGFQKDLVPNGVDFVTTEKEPFLQIRRPHFLKVPAVKISTGPFTLDYDIRLQPSNNQRQILFANWNPGHWQVISFVANGKFSMELRRNMVTGGSDPEQYLINVASKDDFPMKEWVKVTFSWNPKERRARLYFDSVLQDERTVRPSISDVQVMRSDAAYSHFGVKDDDGMVGQLNADIKNIRFFRSERVPQ